MIIKEEVFFKSDIDQVWDLLVKPAMTKQYMFGCEVLSNWAIGDPINWKGKTEDGKDIIFVKGEIIEYEKGGKLTSSMFDPNMGIADVPENYVHLSYQLAKKDEGTLLTIVQGDFSGVENAEQRFEASKKGWEMVIPLMQKVLNSI